MARSNKWYGWVPDLPDQRDLVYAAPMGVLRKLPAKVDLRGLSPAVYSQGELGSCTANAIGAAHQFTQLKQNSENIEHQGREGRKVQKDGIAATAPRGTSLPLRSSCSRSQKFEQKAAKVAKGADCESFMPSRLFIYFNERVIAGTVDEDSGAMLRDGIKTVAKQGVCPEAEWPYVIAKYRIKPSQACYRHALDHQALTYHSVLSLIHISEPTRPY